MPGNNWGGTGLSFPELQALGPLERARRLVDALQLLESSIAILTEQAREARGELWAYVDEQGASVIDGTTVEAIVLVSGSSYTWEYDVEVLSELGAFVAPDVLEQALIPVPATVKVNKNELNKLAKRGGQIRQIIEAGCIKVESGGGRKFELRPRKT